MNDLVFGPTPNTVPCPKCRELMILRIREIAGLSKIITEKERASDDKLESVTSKMIDSRIEEVSELVLSRDVLAEKVQQQEQTIEDLRKKLRTAYDQNTIQRKRSRRQHEDYRDFVTEEEDDRRD